MTGIGVVGLGYWGPNLVRNFANVPGSRLVAVCDHDEDRLGRIGAQYPGVKATTSYAELLDDPDIDAIVIATPVDTHYDLAIQSLRAGKHTLVEKPLTSCSEQAEELIEEASTRNLVLMVDHTFVYTGAVDRIHRMIHDGELGDIYYYDSVRINPGLFQHDVDVLWDLAVHDLSIMDYVLPHRPVAISANGLSHVPGGPENIAFMTLYYDEPMIAHIHANWLAPAKVRRTVIGGSKQTIVYDDLEPSEKIKIYDKGITVTNDPAAIERMRIGYRVGDMRAPVLERSEALRSEALHFLQCIETGCEPRTSGEVGLRLVRMLEAATVSMKEKGAPQEIVLEGVTA
jgi:predicted dehydrogenase